MSLRKKNLGTQKYCDIMSPAELDKQNPLQIDKWLDIGSAEFYELDPDPGLTRKMMRIGFDAGVFYTDSLGRIWGTPSESSKPHYPFHFNLGKKLYGFRLSAKASN